MYKVLSYPMGVKEPVFLDNPPLHIEKYTSIAAGDSCNQSLLKFLNHTGTHLDAPNHFIDSGLRIDEIPLEQFMYRQPYLLDLEKQENELITASDLIPFAARITHADLLLIRTNFGRYRYRDSQKYTHFNPGFETTAANFLLEKGVRLKAVGMDLPSAAAAGHLEAGAQFHQVILGGKDLTGRHGYILVIEDLNLMELDGLEEVWAVPLLVKDLDSSPCTVIGKFN
jgi:arylformamidase